mmetsp:Transcript_111988/g.317073  ORF Transcript_111988/g.317073 Transcript_111988/m.317073 type:complete len:362 (-) Transcript_111988:97-1182(-)
MPMPAILRHLRVGYCRGCACLLLLVSIASLLADLRMQQLALLGDVGYNITKNPTSGTERADNRAAAAWASGTSPDTSTTGRPLSTSTLTGGTTAPRKKGRKRKPPMKAGNMSLVDVSRILQTNRTTMTFPTFGSCALIGSSPILLKKSHGYDIDKHDTVIRINRLPTEDYFNDFGRKTDVLFGNCFTNKLGKVTFMGESVKKCGRPECYRTVDCRHGGPGCSFGMLMFKAGCQSRKKMDSIWGHAPFPVTQVHRNVTHGISHITGRGTHIPSTGFYAFLAFATLCGKLTLYGFGGSTTADGHAVDPNQHSFAWEHGVMRRILGGKMRSKDWRSHRWRKSRESRWLEEQMAVRRRGISIVTD